MPVKIIIINFRLLKTKPNTSRFFLSQAKVFPGHNEIESTMSQLDVRTTWLNNYQIWSTLLWIKKSLKSRLFHPSFELVKNLE